MPTLLRMRILFVVVLCVCAPKWAMADLMVNPSRVVVEKNHRAAQVELINNGKQTATYRILLVNKRMTEYGQFLDVTQAQDGERFADQLVRYAPRQVTLAPGASQVVRLMVRLPAGLAPGEYRSHLLFEPVDTPAPAQEAGSATPEETSKEIGVSFRVKLGISIPVIVRAGEVAPAQLTLSKLQLVGLPDKPELRFDLGRSGDTSAYGDLLATFVPSGGAAQPAGRVGGVAIYAPNPVRHAGLPLKAPAGQAFAHGVLKLEYRARPEDGGALLASAELVLP